MSYSDQDLRNAVDQVFNQFDQDKSHTLDRSEIVKVLNQLFINLKANRQASQQEVDKFLQLVDTNKDGKLTKMELFEVFKRITSK